MSKKILLDEEMAYRAMFEFIKRHYFEINKPDVLGNLLGDMELTPDQYKTSDPAMWNEWVRSIKFISHKNEKGQNNV